MSPPREQWFSIHTSVNRQITYQGGTMFIIDYLFRFRNFVLSSFWVKNGSTVHRISYLPEDRPKQTLRLSKFFISKGKMIPFFHALTKLNCNDWTDDPWCYCTFVHQSYQKALVLLLAENRPKIFRREDCKVNLPGHEVNEVEKGPGLIIVVIVVFGRVQHFTLNYQGIFLVSLKRMLH